MMHKANTYFITTEQNAPEVARLLYQSQLIVKNMGELFPESIDPAQLHRILDVACGPGGWALDVAGHYPDVEVIGFDISPTMIDHARLLAEVEGLANASFHIMDASRPLDFPDHSFDLVNANFIQSFMPPAAWPTALQEFVRVTRPGGIIRLLEYEVAITNSSPVDETYRIFAEVTSQLGRSFSSNGQHIGITPMLRRLLLEAQCQEIQHKPYAFDCSTGSEWHQGFSEDWIMLSRLTYPFIVNARGEEAGDRIKAMLEEGLKDLQSEDFCGILYLLSVWGRTPAAEKVSTGRDA